VTATELECELNAKGLTAVLLHDGKEIAPPGYRPVPMRNWKLTDTGLVCAVRFGPYRAPFTFDSYAILDGDTAKLVIPEDGHARFPAGFLWDWTFELTTEHAAS